MLSTQEATYFDYRSGVSGYRLLFTDFLHLLVITFRCLGSTSTHKNTYDRAYRWALEAHIWRTRWCFSIHTPIFLGRWYGAKSGIEMDRAIIDSRLAVWRMNGLSVFGAKIGGWSACSPCLGRGNMGMAALFVKYILIDTCISGTGSILRRDTSSSERHYPPSRIDTSWENDQVHNDLQVISVTTWSIRWACSPLCSKESANKLATGNNSVQAVAPS